MDMSASAALSRGIHFAHSMAALALLLSACGAKTIEWIEEVRLANNETVVVKRTVRLKANYIAGGGGGAINDAVNEASIKRLTAGSICLMQRFYRFDGSLGLNPRRIQAPSATC